MRFSGNPYWLTTRRPDTCTRCGNHVERGARVFYYPNGRKLLCDAEDCGKQASRDYQAAASDEAFYCGTGF